MGWWDMAGLGHERVNNQRLLLAIVWDPWIVVVVALVVRWRVLVGLGTCACKASAGVLVDTPSSRWGPISRRTSVTCMSLCPTCTPSASTARATSTRSLMIRGTPARWVMAFTRLATWRGGGGGGGSLLLD